MSQQGKNRFQPDILVEVKFYSFFRSLVTQAISSNEIGKVYSVYALIVAFESSVAEALFSKFYGLTLDILPGAYLIIVVVAILLTMPLNIAARKILNGFVTIDNIQEMSKL